MADNEKIDDIDKFTDTEKKKKQISGDTKKKKTAYVEIEPTIDEAVGGTVVISFGRMNPVTVGHEKLVNKVISTAVKAKGTPAVYLSHSEDKSKNPLSYEDKIHYATKAFGSVIKKSNAKTIIEVAKSLQKFDNLIVVVGSDRLKEFDTLLNKYNGKDYKFKTIQAVSAGGRDPDSEGVKGMSASKMRELAANEDLAGFTKGLPKKLKSSASDMMDDVRRGMKMAEEKDELYEVLNRAQRRKRALAMRKARVKIKLGQDRARRKKASTDVLKKRAKKRALGVLKQKFAKHKRYADLEPGEKERIEKKIARVDKSRIEKIAKRMLIQVKKDERERFRNMATDNPVTPKRESVTENRRMQLVNKIKNSGVVKSGSMSKDSGKNQDKDIGHMKGAQPAAYYAKDADGDKMSVSTKKARAAHFKAKKSGPAPGDANAKTKESKHTKKARAMGFTNESTDLNEMWGQRISKKPHMLMDKNNKVKFDKRFKMFKPKQVTEMNEFDIEDIIELMESTESYITEKASKSIADKAKKSGMPKGVLQQVYNRGVAAWKTGHRPGTTPEQWGHARVNSFVTKSKGTWGKADSDLAAKVRKEGVEEMNLDEAATPQMMKAAKAIEAYAKKHGGIDKADFMKAAKMLSSGNAGTNFVKFVDDLDTDPREWLITTMAKHLGKQTVEKMFKVKIREEVEQLDELTAAEKKLINQMYDKKGNLTPLGKKVMNHGKKPGDKGFVESLDDRFETFMEEVELDEDRRTELHHQSMMFTHAMKQAELKKKDPRLAKQHDMAGKLHAKAADMHVDNHPDAKKHSDKANKASKLLGEEVQLDEISPELQKRYKTKAMKQYKQSAKQKEVGYGVAKQSTADKHMKRFMKRHKGIGSAIKRQGGSPMTNKDPKANSMTSKPAPYKKESVELGEKKTFKELRGGFAMKEAGCGGGAGEEGTDKLVKKYKKDTPKS